MFAKPTETECKTLYSTVLQIKCVCVCVSLSVFEITFAKCECPCLTEMRNAYFKVLKTTAIAHEVFQNMHRNKVANRLSPKKTETNQDQSEDDALFDFLVGAKLDALPCVLDDRIYKTPVQHQNQELIC